MGIEFSFFTLIMKIILDYALLTKDVFKINVLIFMTTL